MEEQKKKFTYIDVLDYWKENIGTQKTRKRIYIDKRNYVVALLHYEFKYIEDELAEIFQIDRSSINHAKDKPYFLMKNEDSVFLKNTEELREKFPFLPPEHDRSTIEVLYNVIVALNKETREDLGRYAEKRSKAAHRAAADLIKKALIIFKDE